MEKGQAVWWSFLDSCVEQPWGSHQCAALNPPTNPQNQDERDEDFTPCSVQGLTRGPGALFSCVIPSNQSHFENLETFSESCCPRRFFVSTEDEIGHKGFTDPRGDSD